MVQDDQQVAIQAHTPKGYYSKVMGKLRELPEYAEKLDHELQDLVEALSEVEAYRANYECFRAIVEIPSETLTMESLEDKYLVDQTQLHHSIATDKVAARYERVCKFPVKLVLRVKPAQCGSPSGNVSDASLHAALLMSDHLFEWDERSLVIPKKVDFTKQPALTTGILYGSKWFTYIVQQRSKLEGAITSPSDSLHKQEIDLMFELTTKKDDLIKSVIKTIINYNRAKTYDCRSCNNRHFIQDVTKALGVKKLPAFGASLKQQLEKSNRQCSRKLSRANLTTHTDLDTYVSGLSEEKLHELTVVDLEYLVGKYFFFHVEKWEQSLAPDQWTCQQRNCQLTSIEEQLERAALSSQSNCVLL